MSGCAPLVPVARVPLANPATESPDRGRHGSGGMTSRDPRPCGSGTQVPLAAARVQLGWWTDRREETAAGRWRHGSTTAPNGRDRAAPRHRPAARDARPGRAAVAVGVAAVPVLAAARSGPEHAARRPARAGAAGGDRLLVVVGGRGRGARTTGVRHSVRARHGTARQRPGPLGAAGHAARRAPARAALPPRDTAPGSRVAGRLPAPNRRRPPCEPAPGPGGPGSRTLLARLPARPGPAGHRRGERRAATERAGDR